MNKNLHTEILNEEERLRLAMLASDLVVLDQALADDLLFTNHFGQRLDKAMDLAAHEGGLLKISKIELTDQKLVIAGEGTVIVSVNAEIDGIYSGQPAGGNFAFTRVWTKASGRWQVIAAHSSLIA